MKPLVYYCRWQGARLRLRGRSDTAVWGQLIFQEEGQETAQNFRCELQVRKLILETDGRERVVQLDEMGVIIGR